MALSLSSCLLVAQGQAALPALWKTQSPNTVAQPTVNSSGLACPSLKSDHSNTNPPRRTVLYQGCHGQMPI